MNKTDLASFVYKGSVNTTDGNTVTTYEKKYNGYHIIYTTHENEWGGKSIITIELLPVFGESKGIHYMRPPVIQFFATGFDGFVELEKKIQEEIVPTLQKWAIKVL